MDIMTAPHIAISQEVGAGNLGLRDTGSPCNTSPSGMNAWG